MKKIAIIYFSETGNTEQMAYSVLEGITSAGCEADLFTTSEIDASKALEYDALVLGCPAMGQEELDESMEELFSSIEGSLSGKTISLFGSYGWGDGEWMRTWEARVVASGAALVDSVICNEAPDEEATNKCVELGTNIVK